MIPSNVVSIGKDAFMSSKLKYLEFDNNSKLNTIDEGAFSYSSIKNILIPASVSFIGENCFLRCAKLESNIFEDNSQLQKFGNIIHLCSSLKCILIPPKIQNINISRIFNENLKIIEIQTNSNIFEFDGNMPYRHIDLTIFIRANVKICCKTNQYI